MCYRSIVKNVFFFFQAEDGIRDGTVTGVQTCALPIWARTLGAERVRNPRAGRRRFLEQRRRLGLDARGKAEIEGPVGGVHDVARHVAQRAGSEVPPAAPLERGVGGVIGSLRSGPEPEIPVERRRDVVLLERPIERLGPDRPVGPEM